jgi:sulfite exporter TauE/SafE
MTYDLLFPVVLGATSSFTHCVGMCGPIQMMINQQRDYYASGWYHAGRVLGYTILGLLVGLLGTAVGFMETTQYKMGARILMITLYIVFAFYFLIQSDKVEKIVGKVFPHRAFQNILRGKNRLSVLGAGVLGSLLPCPTTLAALAWATHLGNPAGASLAMFAMGVSTLPAFLVMSHKFVAQKILNGVVMQRLLGVFFLVMAGHKVWMMIGMAHGAEPPCH